MSNYFAPTKHPITGLIEHAEWLDDYFGKHQYGVRFKDGKVYSADICQEVETTDQTAKVIEQLTLAYSFLRDPEIGRAIDEIKRLTKVVEELKQALEKANGRVE